MEFSSAEVALNALKTLVTDRIELDHYKDVCAFLRANIEGLDSPTLSDQPHGSAPAGVEGDEIARYMDFLDLTEIKTQNYNDKLHAVTAILSRVKKPYLDILVGRYILGMSWVDISLKLGYSQSHTYRLHRDALQAYTLAFGAPK